MGKDNKVSINQSIEMRIASMGVSVTKMIGANFELAENLNNKNSYTGDPFTKGK
jgi:hypothetical protein